VIADGLATEEELRETVEQLYSFARNPHTVLGGPRIFQAWGRSRTKGVQSPSAAAIATGPLSRAGGWSTACALRPVRSHRWFNHALGGGTPEMPLFCGTNPRGEMR
jgi:hypothetical protein